MNTWSKASPEIVVLNLWGRRPLPHASQASPGSNGSGAAGDPHNGELVGEKKVQTGVRDLVRNKASNKLAFQSLTYACTYFSLTQLTASLC